MIDISQLWENTLLENILFGSTLFGNMLSGKTLKENTQLKAIASKNRKELQRAVESEE